MTLLSHPFQVFTLSGGVLLGVILWAGCDFQRDSPPQLDAKDSTFVNSIGMRFQHIPAGQFHMGSEDGQEDERPIREVEITESFFMGTYEVTQAQWEVLMEENPSSFQGPYFPVERISWYRAQVFIDRLNTREDTDRYRLPTEAEWEYAARGGTDSRYYFGEATDSLRFHAWYSFNSDEKTHPVGRKQSNPFGLHDLYGNVWEWVADAYDPTFYEGSERLNPINRGQRRAPRVIRGGGWFAVVSDLRSANRGWAQPDARDEQLGFRIVREIREEGE